MAKKIIRRADLPPGSPPSAIAKASGVEVMFRSNLGLGVRGCADPFLCAIYVAPMHYRPRVEWTIAHELAEREVREPLDDDQEHERYCQAIAAAVMMPEAAFVPSVRASNLSIPILARLWPHCSREAIATRMADLFPRTVVSAWQGSDAKFRRAHAGYRPPAELLDLEAFVAAEAAWYRKESEVRAGDLVERAWPARDGRALSLCMAA